MQVCKFFVPNDFVVMDIEADVLVPIILGRPFLAITGARIDVREGLLNLTIGDAEVLFQFNKTMKGPSMNEMVETVLKVDEEAEMDTVHEEEVVAIAETEFEGNRAELKEELQKELRAELIEELKEIKKEEEFPPGFLPRPKDHKVYAIGEDDYAFGDLLFGEGRKKEKKRWRSQG